MDDHNMDANKLVNASVAVTKEAKALLTKLLGPALDEAGALLGDNVRQYRLRNQIRLLEKTGKILEKKGLTPKAVKMNVLLPLLEAAALEDDEDMSDRWASLLASAADPSEDKHHLTTSFIEVLKQLPPAHAFILDVIYKQVDSKQISQERWEEEGVILEYLRSLLKVEEIAFRIALENLIRLSLVAYPSVTLSRVNGNTLRTQTNSAGFICPTQFGYAFIRACREKPSPRPPSMSYGVPVNSIDNVFQGSPNFLRGADERAFRNI